MGQKFARNHSISYGFRDIQIEILAFVINVHVSTTWKENEQQF